MFKKFAIGAVLAAAVTLGFAAPASAAELPPGYEGAPVFTPGSSITVGQGPGTIPIVFSLGWPEGTIVTFTFDGPGAVTLAVQSTVKAPVDGDGNVLGQFVFEVPGVYTVQAQGDNGATADFTIGVPEVPGGSVEGMPGGVDATPFLWIGGALAVVGIALLVTLLVVRRNRDRVAV